VRGLAQQLPWAAEPAFVSEPGFASETALDLGDGRSNESATTQRNSRTCVRPNLKKCEATSGACDFHVQGSGRTWVQQPGRRSQVDEHPGHVVAGWVMKWKPTSGLDPGPSGGNSRGKGAPPCPPGW